MPKIEMSTDFLRAFKRLKRNADLATRAERAIKMLAADPKHPSLRTHALKGAFDGLWACSAAYDLRIVFEDVVRKETQERVLVLLDIGTHDDVY